MTNFINKPNIRVKGEFACTVGWKHISEQLDNQLSRNEQKKNILVVECYQGVFMEELIEGITQNLSFSTLTITNKLMHNTGYITQMVYPDVTDDRIFGFMTRLTIDKYFDDQKVKEFRDNMSERKDGLHVIIGSGAAYICPNPDLLVYADMDRV